MSASPGVNSSTESGDDQLVKALQTVLEDETFKFNSKAAMEARQAAVLLLEWAKNLSRIKQFLQQLQEKLEDCLKFLTPGSINRDRLWQSFFVLRSSDQFTTAWKDFLLTAKVNPTPTLYQHLTSIMFHDEIRKKNENNEYLWKCDSAIE